MLPGVDDATRALIERVQPHPERDRFYRPTTFEETTYHLGLLNELCNIEKHRHPNFVVESVVPALTCRATPLPTSSRGRWSRAAWWPRWDYYPEFAPYVSMQPRFSFSTLLVHPGGPSAMPGVLWVMNFMVARVLDVLDPSPLLNDRRKQHLAPHPGAEEAAQLRRAFQQNATRLENDAWR